MRVLVFAALVALCAAAIPRDWSTNYKRYKGYKVLAVTPSTAEQHKLLRQWMLEDTRLDFWREASHGDSAHIMVPPKYLTEIQTKLRKHNFSWTTYIENVQEQIDGFMIHEAKRRASAKMVFDINDFNTYTDIIGWIENTVPSQCAANGLTCTTAQEGLTYEGRRIVSLTMSSGGAGKQTFLMNSLIHAREWLAGATVSKIIEHISTSFGSDPTVTQLLTDYDFVIIPVLNPDGYEFTWTTERLWRKNRFPSGTCIGIDLNRNYDYNWGLEGVSTNPCSDIYCGPSANSELETQIMDAIMSRYANGAGVIGYLDVHCYGYMWMHPWGNTINFNGVTCERAADHDDMFWVADRAANAIEATHNTQWARGTSCEVIYATTGATDDYIKGVHGVKYPICPELRGNSFVVSNTQIQPSFEEIWNGIVEMILSIEIRGI